MSLGLRRRLNVKAKVASIGFAAACLPLLPVALDETIRTSFSGHCGADIRLSPDGVKQQGKRYAQQREKS